MPTAKLQNIANGRLPSDVADAGQAQTPVPEYIETAGTPSEETWAREQELYRRGQAQRMRRRRRRD